MHKYYVDFLVTHEKGSSPLRANTSIETDKPIDTESSDDFVEIAKTLYTLVKDENLNDPPPYSVSVMRVAEDSEELQGLLEILNKDRMTVDDTDDYDL